MTDSRYSIGGVTSLSRAGGDLESIEAGLDTVAPMTDAPSTDDTTDLTTDVNPRRPALLDTPRWLGCGRRSHRPV